MSDASGKAVTNLLCTSTNHASKCVARQHVIPLESVRFSTDRAPKDLALPRLSGTQCTICAVGFPQMCVHYRTVAIECDVSTGENQRAPKRTETSGGPMIQAARAALVKEECLDLSNKDCWVFVLLFYIRGRTWWHVGVSTDPSDPYDSDSWAESIQQLAAEFRHVMQHEAYPVADVSSRTVVEEALTANWGSCRLLDVLVADK